MTDLMLQMGPICIVAGLGAGWLADALLSRKGYGLIVDLGIGMGTSLLGGAALLALAGAAPGMFAMFAIGFALASGALVAQRLGWPADPDAHERRVRDRIAELSRSTPRGAGGTASEVADPGIGRATRAAPASALARLATTGIYMLRGVPIDVQRAARIRAAREATTIRQVLLKGVAEYAAGTWTPQPDDAMPGPHHTRLHATGP